MKSKNSLFTEIISRRIPQILGMYIASVWLAVEIAEWMSNKFSLPAQLSSYVFISMLIFIPSVIMLAWGHGKPGKDRWSKLELAWIPVNIALSIYAASTFEPNTKELDEPIKIQQIAKIQADETLQTSKTNEVENNNYNRVISFFWKNQTEDASLEWLSYGLPWLFSEDLRRTPNISAVTPFNYDSIIRDLKSKGYINYLNIPMSLASQIANERLFKWMIFGTYTKIGDKFTFKTKLYNVKTGALKKEFTATNTNLFKALDNVSEDISELLLDLGSADRNIIPDLAIEDHISNNLQAIELAISALNHEADSNDYKLAIIDLLKALELDPSFALANVYLSYFYRGLGDYPNAIKHTKKALLLDHKIYKERLFAIKSGLFDMQGETEKALLILENWVSTFPQSPRARSRLAHKYLYSKGHLNDAEAEYTKLLELDNGNAEALYQLGRIYRAREDKPKTLNYLGKYLEKHPDDEDAYMQMGRAFNQFSMFKKAIKMYQQASILGTKDYAAEIAIAYTVAKSGDYKKALIQLDELVDLSTTDLQLYSSLRAKQIIYTQTGQIAKAFEVMDKLEKPASKVLSPFDYLFNIDSDRIGLYSEIGEFKQAIAYADNLKENSKPPFDYLTSIFYILIYFEMQEVEEFEKVFTEFDTFLENFPLPVFDSLSPAWNGILAMWAGDTQKAIVLLDESILSLKDSILYIQTFDITDELVYNKAIALSSLDKDEQALDELDSILNRNPLFGRAHYQMAKIYYKLKQNDKAQESIHKAQQIWQDADENFTDLINLNALILSQK